MALAALLLGGCVEPAPPQLLGYGIIGGEPTEHWPAVGAYLIDGGQGGLCTGTLIDERTVVTAAHCAAGWGPNRADEFFLGPSAYDPDQRVDVEEVAIHPDYDAEQHEADLAVLVLDAIPGPAGVALNDATVNDAWIGTLMRVVGYGTTDTYDGDTMGGKRQTDVEVLDVAGDLILHETEGHNTCAGDSGGPALVKQGEDWVLVGVVSFVYPAAPDQDACSGGGGEIRVDAYRDWLHGYMNLPPPQNDDDDWTPPDPDGSQACQCTAAGGGRGGALGAGLLLGLWLRLRRSRARGSRAGSRPSAGARSRRPARAG